MSFHTTYAQSSRVRKTSAHKSASPFRGFARKKPTLSPHNSKGPEEDFDDGGEDDEEGLLLEDHGLTQALATDATLRDVPQAMLYIHTRRWSPLPDRRSGMGATRTAEVLNFRRAVPAVVTVTHVQALLNSPTMVEREVAELVARGALRKLVVPGRGELLILACDLDALIDACAGLDDDGKTTFRALLRAQPHTQRLPRASVPEALATACMQSGFLTHAATDWTSSDAFGRAGGDAWKGTAISMDSIAQAVSGTVAAVGGAGVIHDKGGSGGRMRSTGAAAGDLTISVPGIGLLLKLLSAAQQHLAQLLSKAPSRQLPEAMLKQRWEGGVAVSEDIGLAKRHRGEFAGVLPGRTRKWKQFYGLSFDCVLGEALGAGLVEVFDTGNSSLGRGVRLLKR